MLPTEMIAHLRTAGGCCFHPASAQPDDYGHAADIFSKEVAHMFSVQCNLPHILRQHTAESNRLLYHLRPAACRRRLSRRHHEITLVGDGTLRFLGLRSLAPTAVSARS